MKPGEEPAFPAHVETYDTKWDGMSIRDYFAASAMQALLGADWPVSSITASEAFKAADFMLAARERKDGE